MNYGISEKNAVIYRAQLSNIINAIDHCLELGNAKQEDVEVLKSAKNQIKNLYSKSPKVTRNPNAKSIRAGEVSEDEYPRELRAIQVGYPSEYPNWDKLVRTLYWCAPIVFEEDDHLDWISREEYNSLDRDARVELDDKIIGNSSALGAVYTVIKNDKAPAFYYDGKFYGVVYLGVATHITNKEERFEELTSILRSDFGWNLIPFEKGYAVAIEIDNVDLWKYERFESGVDTRMAEDIPTLLKEVKEDPELLEALLDAGDSVLNNQRK